MKRFADRLPCAVNVMEYRDKTRIAKVPMYDVAITIAQGVVNNASTIVQQLSDSMPVNFYSKNCFNSTFAKGDRLFWIDFRVVCSVSVT